MQIEMTFELQAALIDRLKNTIATLVGENQLMTIVVESSQGELNRVRAELSKLVEINKHLTEKLDALQVDP